MNIKIKNFYYLIAGILAILFAVTHAWNGQSAVLPKLDIQEISVSTQIIHTYVWHMITVENLVFGIAFILMSLQKTEPLNTPFTAWLIVAILIVRLMVILIVTTLLHVSDLTDTLIDSIAIVIYIALIILGTRMENKQYNNQQSQQKS